MEIYDTVLNLLNLEGDTLDSKKADQIKTIINVVSERLTARLTMLIGKTVEDVPGELAGIVAEISVNRFNRIGSEGASGHSIDGETFNWSDTDYFAPYEKDINAYVASQGRSVGVQFL